MKLNTTLLGILILVSTLLGQLAQAMPEKLCIAKISSNVTSQVQARLRASLFYLGSGYNIYEGDLYPASYTKVSSRSGGLSAAPCFDTQTLINEFNKKGLSTNGYYLTNVRLDIRYLKDCNLSGNKAVHSWMAAPRNGKAYFDVVIGDTAMITHGGKCVIRE